MGFREQLELDAAQVFLNSAEFAQNVLFEGRTIRGVFEEGEDAGSGNTFTSDGQAARASLWVLVADIPDPSPRQVVEVEGRTWRIARKLEGDRILQRLELTADEAVVRL